MVPLKNLEILRNPYLERISEGCVNEYINTYRSFMLITNIIKLRSDFIYSISKLYNPIMC